MGKGQNILLAVLMVVVTRLTMGSKGAQHSLILQARVLVFLYETLSLGNRLVVILILDIGVLQAWIHGDVIRDLGELRIGGEIGMVLGHLTRWVRRIVHDGTGAGRETPRHACLDTRRPVRVCERLLPGSSAARAWPASDGIHSGIKLARTIIADRGGADLGLVLRAAQPLEMLPILIGLAAGHNATGRYSLLRDSGRVMAI